MTSASDAVRAATDLIFIDFPSLGGRSAVSVHPVLVMPVKLCAGGAGSPPASESVMQDLAEEVLGAGALRGGIEEGVRIVLLHDLPIGHEDHPIGRLAGEPPSRG